MPEVRILEDRITGGGVVVHGTVDGEGCSVTVPLAMVDAALTTQAKREVLARALWERWKRKRTVSLGIAGTVALTSNGQVQR